RRYSIASVGPSCGRERCANHADLKTRLARRLAAKARTHLGLCEWTVTVRTAVAVVLARAMAVEASPERVMASPRVPTGEEPLQVTIDSSVDSPALKNPCDTTHDAHK
ncbi:MAG: hypothetical protein J2P17_13415, partial [Mycobacterium sp.]|nr:hypothetical protein [Mycobacterium sp.]